MPKHRLRTIFLLAALLVTLPSLAYKKPPIENPVTPEWTEQYLHQTGSALLNDSEQDHVMSYYYFGAVNGRTLMGLERVRGDDYDQFFSLMVFEQQTLLGFYQNVPSFPSGVDSAGNVSFPRGVDAHPRGLHQPFNILTDEFLALCQGIREDNRCIEWQPATPEESH